MQERSVYAFSKTPFTLQTVHNPLPQFSSHYLAQFGGPCTEKRHLAPWVADKHSECAGVPAESSDGLTPVLAGHTDPLRTAPPLQLQLPHHHHPLTGAETNTVNNTNIFKYMNTKPFSAAFLTLLQQLENLHHAGNKPPGWWNPPESKHMTRWRSSRERNRHAHVQPFVSTAEQSSNLYLRIQPRITLWVRMSFCFQPSLWIRCSPPADVPNASHFLDTAKQVHCKTPATQSESADTLLAHQCLHDNVL